MSAKNAYQSFKLGLVVLSILLPLQTTMAQTNINNLGELINNVDFELPVGFGITNKVRYTFVNAGCYCSISQATTGKKEKSNTIVTYSFDLAELKDGRILVSKPKDTDFKSIVEDIWRIEIGIMDILVQNTDWQSRQTKTNHFYFLIEGTEDRDKVIDALTKSVTDCGGSISDATILNN